MLSQKYLIITLFVILCVVYELNKKNEKFDNVSSEYTRKKVNPINYCPVNSKYEKKNVISKLVQNKVINIICKKICV